MTDHPGTHWGEAPCASNYNLQQKTTKAFSSGSGWVGLCFCLALSLLCLCFVFALSLLCRWLPLAFFWHGRNEKIMDNLKEKLEIFTF